MSFSDFRERPQLESQAAVWPLTAVPLCVDLDGTLIRTDTLHEGFLLLLKRNPLYGLLALFWLLQGKSRFKREVASRVTLDPAQLPYTEELVEYLRQQSAAGRPLYLVTAADGSWAEPVARHLGIFQGVLASDGVVNLSGIRKRDMLVARFGEGGFDYAGDSRTDLPVWAAARQAVAVRVSAGVRAKLDALATPVAADFVRPPVGVKGLFRAIRAHQWAKNLLLFIPLLLAHQWSEWSRMLAVLAGFCALSLLASACYIVNDLLDLAADRRHPSKRRRPIAAGTLSIASTVLLVPGLLLLGMLCASPLPPPLWLLLAAYVCITISYSAYFKRKLYFDVATLAGLYALRIWAGAVAAQVPVSPWLIMFSVFFFSSLALAKRVSELLNLRKSGGDRTEGRGYSVDDQVALAIMGISSAYVAVLVLGLYMNSSEVSRLYRQPQLLWWVSPLVLYWSSRLWLIAWRGQMHEDPVVFAIRDKVSYIVGGAIGVLVLGAL